MSYTMTIDMPERAATYVGRSPKLRREINAIVVAVVTMRMAAAKSRRPAGQRGRESALAQWERLVKQGEGRLEKPYRFRRADAYDEDLG